MFRGQNNRGGTEEGIPYLPILSFNGCPLLAVGSVEIGVELGYCLVLFSPFSMLSSTWAGGRGIQPQRVIKPRRDQGSLSP